MRLWIIALSLLVFSGLPSAVGQQQNPAHAQNDKAIQDCRSAVVPVNDSTTVVQQVVPQQKTYDWPQIALVGVGIAGIIVGVITLKKIEVQSEAAKVAAEAANVSVESLKRAERAWMIGEVSLGDIARFSKIIAVCELKNCGKTVARITERGDNFSIQPNRESLPVVPDYGSIMEWKNGVLIAPETTIFHAIFTTDKSGWTDVVTGNQKLFVFGYVKYLDAFGDPHETRYIVQYDPANEFFGVDDHPEYNKAT